MLTCVLLWTTTDSTVIRSDAKHSFLCHYYYHYHHYHYYNFYFINVECEIYSFFWYFSVCKIDISLV